jgi:hypothetical protein
MVFADESSFAFLSPLLLEYCSGITQVLLLFRWLKRGSGGARCLSVERETGALLYREFGSVRSPGIILTAGNGL